MNRKGGFFGMLLSTAFSRKAGMTSKADERVLARRAARLEPTLPRPGGAGATPKASRWEQNAVTVAQRKAETMRLAAMEADRKKTNLQNAAERVRRNVAGKQTGNVIRLQPRLAPARRDDDPWHEMNGNSDVALARARERARMRAILFSPEAKGRWELAKTLAVTTTMSAGKARLALSLAPVETRTGYEAFLNAPAPYLPRGYEVVRPGAAPTYTGRVLPLERTDS